ncbi:HD domain-containing protein [Geomonas sp. Red69]|uniref:HD domain-containing protein n=1 Tax=Geomonas diazotrophica TaxID=2843197 RepID=A0ABX8JMS0_9BACT|nr:MULTISPECIES: HD domain-containing protein [Geomonas]MBU5637301.1 HD domain-containing protein [Geomonas diazotrophica]QWV99588.1 HD domain-containing protein [Geomonas nitrogeniifigens]QXE88762.1 HD domain-containing protein [Geomonas nitrogeniifigens]
MNPRALLEKYFQDNQQGLEIVYRHSRKVADKALSIAARAGRSDAELLFIEEAALLHDIGVARTYAPKLNCFGNSPYICHGLIGRKMLEAEGLPHHALVCERHIGVGLTARDIAEQRLRLPLREMSPVTDCERIVALADLFYSKKGGELDLEKSTDQVRSDLLRFGQEKVRIFESWLKEFSLDSGAEAPAPSN